MNTSTATAPTRAPARRASLMDRYRLFLSLLSLSLMTVVALAI